MKIYLIDIGTGEYLGSQECQMSPAEKGVYLKPNEGTYTEIEPPEISEHQTVIWNGRGWSIKSDWRGVKAWKMSNGEKISITEIGIEPSEEVTEDDPQGFTNPVYDNGVWREKTDEEIWKARYGKDPVVCIDALCSVVTGILNSRFDSDTFTLNGFDYQIDDRAQSNLDRFWKLLDKGLLSYPVEWRSKTNTMVQITSEKDLLALVAAMAVKVNSVWNDCFTVKDTLRGATDFATVWAAFIGYQDK